MDHLYPAEDCAAGLLERRWFATNRAASEVQAECEALADMLEMAQDAWRTARSRLAQLEALRDALSEELAAVDQRELQGVSVPQEKSAA